MAAISATSKTAWINRFLMRLDELEPELPILGAVSFALKRYIADPEDSPEEAAEIYLRERPR
jgi:hypothetical protein